jgi:archaellum component FlaF (FlaF/FlaG flagellin family)
MSIIQGTGRGGARGFYDFPIEQSLRFDGSSYLSRVQTTGNRTTMTYSTWVKRSNIGAAHLLYDGNASTTESSIYISGEKVLIEYYHAPTNYYKRGVELLRDLSAWYHLVFVIDTGNSTTAHRFRIYINSVEIVNDVYNAPSSSLNMDFNENGSTAYIGRRGGSYFNGYLANIQFIDGQALDQYFFGEFKDNIWVPYNAFSTAGSGTATASDGDTATDSYGTNGFHLDFADSSNIGNDVSGNNNDWTVN